MPLDQSRLQQPPNHDITFIGEEVEEGLSANLETFEDKSRRSLNILLFSLSKGGLVDIKSYKFQSKKGLS